ncbi:25176_t:CDS:2, partial [Gigaspora rosea]
VYFDGHEREDVQEYRKGWAMRMMNYQKKMEQYDGDEMENVIPPERLEIWDTCHVLVTYDKAYFYANDNNSFVWVEDKESIIKKKGQGLAIMASDFLCACHGPLHLTEADAIRLGLDREARVIIKPGQQADGYWKSENMVQQLREKAIPIFNALHPGRIGISTNYNTYALDALVCSRMTLYPKVENKFKFKDGWYICDYEKSHNLCFFLDENNGTVKFKGIKKILEERNMWTGQRLDCRRKEDDEKGKRKNFKMYLTAEEKKLPLRKSIFCRKKEFPPQNVCVRGNCRRVYALKNDTTRLITDKQLKVSDLDKS